MMQSLNTTRLHQTKHSGLGLVTRKDMQFVSKHKTTVQKSDFGMKVMCLDTQT